MSDTELDVSSIESLEAELPDDFASPAQDSRRSSLNVPPVVVEEAAAQGITLKLANGQNTVFVIEYEKSWKETILSQIYPEEETMMAQVSLKSV